jgi:hypothetical protein
MAAGRPFLAMFTPSEPTRLPAGGHHILPIRALVYGVGGGSDQCYWTEPGRYTLTARLQLGVEVQGTTGPVLVSNPVVLEVR